MVQSTTLAFLGCGNMGLAILNGLLASPPATDTNQQFNSTPTPNPTSLKPTNFILCVRSDASKIKLEHQFADQKPRISVMKGRNVDAARSADAVLLACKPHMVRDLLGEAGLMEALQGKLLISVIPGWSRVQLEEVMYGSATTEQNASSRCWVVRTMPNVACAVMQSATAVEVSTPELPERYMGIVDAVFTTVGTVTRLPPAQMDACTAFGSTPAFFAIICDALIDGAVAMGMPRVQAREMAVQCMRGTADLMLAGESATGVKEMVTSPGGCTIGAIMTLEEAGLRGIMSRALRESASIASVLGQGYSNVNGTRGMSKP